MKIYVASKNPVKINAVTIALSESYPDVKVIGKSVPSGVSAQPMTDRETLTGSINRAKALKELILSKKIHPPREELLFIGAEGGVYHPSFAKKKEELWSTVWISVLDQEDNVYSASGARFRLPQVLADGILAGQELGSVVGALFDDQNLKQKSGAIGVLTKNFIDRTEEYVSITKLAIGLWYGRTWQNQASIFTKL
ncbi:MAG: inosine/xanthosine triphosphatase [Patescibacteria group bacterium]